MSVRGSLCISIFWVPRIWVMGYRTNWEERGVYLIFVHVAIHHIRVDVYTTRHGLEASHLPRHALNFRSKVNG
jgi:hypothetical protein